MGNNTLSINFGKLDAHDYLRDAEKFNPNLHEKDFNLRTEKPRLPSINIVPIIRIKPKLL
jgi:hypothetical protein